MWFKNLAIYRFTESFNDSAETLAEKLESMQFTPCTQQQQFSAGWTAPLALAEKEDSLVHSANGFLMLCLKKQEKVLPNVVIAEIVAERAEEAEEKQGRKLNKKERTELKDEVIFELLPQAFAFSRKTYAYIDPKGGWIVVDAASAKKAEDLLSLLRKTLGSLPVVPPTTKNRPINVMTQWLIEEKSPTDIEVEDECELRSPEEDGGIIRCKRHDLAAPEIKNHLETGKQVSKLAISWAERLSFIVDDSLMIKRLRFLELVQDQVTDTQANDEIEQFDADFSIMTAELANFLPHLLEIFGGES